MSLPDATISRLKDVLKQATARVYADGEFQGTAFYVDTQLLLTCAHVVDRDAGIEIQPDGRDCREAQVVEWDDATDLALLKAQARDEPVIPCAVLDTTLHDGEYWLVGYPREEGTSPGYEPRKFTGHGREDPRGGYQMLQLSAGEIITWGMSGGPALSTESGAVVAVTRASRNTDDALGGNAVPIGLAAAKFGEIARVLQESTPQMVPWRTALGRPDWQRLGRSRTVDALFDLWVSGSRNSWQVSMEEPGHGHELTGRDLGEGVAEALFRWVQRRRVHSNEEVELIGPLLASALFPSEVARRFEQVRAADDLLVRLHLKSGCDLADIPWELAAAPRARGRARFLAAEEKFGFVRVPDTDRVNGDALSSAAPARVAADVRVLAAVAQPKHWRNRYPVILPRHRGPPYKWVGLTEMRASLRESIERAGFTPELDLLHVPPRWSVVKDALKSGSFSVLHFMGVGQREIDGTPLIAFVDDDGNGEAWQDPREVIDTAAASGVRLVVLELLLPPMDCDFEPLTPSALGEIIARSVTAVVLTQLPVHPVQCRAFNSSFYEALGRAERIESAVQAGRRTLRLDRPVEDAAGFGWFALTTGSQSDVRLVIQESPDASKPAIHTPVAKRPVRHEPHPRETLDVLHR